MITVGFEAAAQAQVISDEALPEHEQIWVWDQFYTAVLHVLAERPEGEWLRRTMEDWAAQVIARIFEDPAALAADGASTVVPDLAVREGGAAGMEAVHVLNVVPQASGWPELELHLPQGEAERTARAVVALAHYFLQLNPLFIKDLALHVFAMRKYYIDVAPPTEERSMAEAPQFALQKAMKFFEDMSSGRPH
ncbi:hypothetical protein HUS23_00280 [Ectothiorhodospiraceae bacterium 2226]|nr:hypothetical protein HUS23_00280 [Ectothiorhodospiraceae bacterium 2226]